MPFTEDLSVFLNPAEFGTTGTVGGLGINGIFDRAFLSTLGIDAQGPVFLVRDADVTARAIVADSVVTIAGTAYRVTSLQPDGTGMTLLILEA